MRVAGTARPKPGDAAPQAEGANSSSEQEKIQSALETLESTGDFRILRKIYPQSTFSSQTADICVLIIDTETSGMEIKDGHKVIEIGGILVGFNKESGAPVEVYDTYSELEYPGFDLDPDNIAVHGITNEDLTDKAFDDDKLNDLASKADLVICHNSRFDRPFLEERFPVFKDKVFGCSLLDVEWAKSGYRSGKLEFIAVDQGKFYEAHRALEDCVALLSILSEKMPDTGEMPFQKILRNCIEPSFIIGAYRSPFAKNPVLKKLGFTFNKEESIWEISCSNKLRAREVSELLQAQVYETKDPITIKVKTLSPKDRFSATPTIGEYFQINPSESAGKERPSAAAQTGDAASKPVQEKLPNPKADNQGEATSVDPSVSASKKPVEDKAASASGKTESSVDRASGTRYTPRASTLVQPGQKQALESQKESSSSERSNPPVSRQAVAPTARTSIKVAPPKRNNGPTI